MRRGGEEREKEKGRGEGGTSSTDNQKYPRNCKLLFQDNGSHRRTVQTTTKKTQYQGQNIENPRKHLRNENREGENKLSQ